MYLSKSKSSFLPVVIFGVLYKNKNNYPYTRVVTLLMETLLAAEERDLNKQDIFKFVVTLYSFMHLL